MTEIYYNPYDDDVWVGLDKSAICVSKHAHLGGGGGFFKYRPCGACKGFGEVNGTVCTICEGKGIDLAHGEAHRAPVQISSKSIDSGVMRVGGEEITPDSGILSQMETLRQQTGVDISLGHWDYLLERYQKEIAQIEQGDFTDLKVRSSPEFNPNTTGGYVTRIRTKQRLADSENKLLAGETLAAMALINGQKAFSYDRIWRNFLLCAFHDAAYGTIVDAGYDEIMKLYDEVDTVCRAQYLRDDFAEHQDETRELYLFNPTSVVFNGLYHTVDGRLARVCNLPPYTAKQIECLPPPEVILSRDQQQSALLETVFTGKEEIFCRLDDGEVFGAENEYFKLEADEKGIRRVIDKRFGIIADTVNGARPFEWVLQSDIGSPWATLEPPQVTTPLAEQTALYRVERGETYTRICYKTQTSMKGTGEVFAPVVCWSVLLIDGCDRIMLEANAKWGIFNRRLMVRFPLTVENGRDIYGIPGGWLHREPYEPSYEWNGANGDWPAFRFGGLESAQKSVAILNCGTPSYRITAENGCKHLYVSVLRSPAYPVCLHEPESYTMLEYDGMRDEGEHRFHLEMVAYGSTFGKSHVFADAEQVSRSLLPIDRALPIVEMPLVLSGTAMVTHIKPAEDGKGIVIRITEQSGQDGEICLSVPEWVTDIYKSDMPEQEAEKISFDKTVFVRLRGFEIATLKFFA
ncbi:MAG: hypothetical protein E7487_04660 [Ruminococcaceae bacterium]|nr:hypothetical protein [Oscillospiraceae bacterium]